MSCSVCVDYLCHVLFVLIIYVMFCLCYLMSCSVCVILCHVLFVLIIYVMFCLCGLSMSCSVCVKCLCHVLFVLSIYVMFCLC